MKYRIFLDDERFPAVDFSDDNDVCTTIVRSYDDFCKVIHCYSLPVSISFDHDLGIDKTGLDCAKYLVNYMIDNDLKDFPEYYVHSQNPCGRDNIISLIESFKNHLEREKEDVP